MCGYACNHIVYKIALMVNLGEEISPDGQGQTTRPGLENEDIFGIYFLRLLRYKHSIWNDTNVKASLEKSSARSFHTFNQTKWRKSSKKIFKIVHHDMASIPYLFIPKCDVRSEEVRFWGEMGNGLILASIQHKLFTLGHVKMM